MTRVALMLSRRPRLWTPRSWWLRATWETARFGVRQGWTLVAAREPAPLAFAAWCWQEHGGAIEESAQAARAAWAERDRWVVERSDVVIAVAVRAGGLMERLALESVAKRRVLAVDADESACAGNRTLIEAGAERLALTVELPPPRARPARTAGEQPADCLWHYTRSTPGPWPGQSEEEYYRSLVENRPGAAHTADDALDRILAERRIRASGRLIRDRHAVVCFSAAAPAELIAVRAYKPALVRWDFEPAAIGVPRVAAERLGARPVIYAAPAAYGSIAPEERYLFQKHDPPGVDFTHEKEWRVAGDFPLESIGPEEITVFRG